MFRILREDSAIIRLCEWEGQKEGVTGKGRKWVVMKELGEWWRGRRMGEGQGGRRCEGEGEEEGWGEGEEEGWGEGEEEWGEGEEEGGEGEEEGWRERRGGRGEVGR